MTPRRSPLRLAGPLLAALAALCFVFSPGCERTTGAIATPATPAAAPVSAPTQRPAPRQPPAPADAAGYDLRPAEKSAIEGFLRENPDLRVASDSDHQPGDEGDDMAGLYAVYHPYFVRGDANDDGLLDFVLALVRRDSDRDAPWFSVVVFSGRSDGTFVNSGFLEREVSLAAGDLSIDRDTIVVTPDTGDDLTRRYRWDPARKRHVFVRDAPEESTSPAPAQI